MSKLHLPQRLEFVEDRGFSYVHFPKHAGEVMPIIVARDLQPEYARFFASAPDLLAACKKAAMQLEGMLASVSARRMSVKWTDDDLKVLLQLQSAIAKAEGRNEG